MFYDPLKVLKKSSYEKQKICKSKKIQRNSKKFNEIQKIQITMIHLERQFKTSII